MATFTTPSSPLVPPLLPETRGLQRMLWRHYGSRMQGRNVYIINGVVTENDPVGGEASVITFYGGHDPYEVTAAQAALLIAAGYTIDQTPATWGELTGDHWNELTTTEWENL